MRGIRVAGMLAALLLAVPLQAQAARGHTGAITIGELVGFHGA